MLRGLLKFVIVTVLLLVVLGVAALAFLPRMLGKDDINTILARYTPASGREITIHGDASVSFLPKIALAMEKVEIRDMHTEGVKPLYFDKISVRADFFELLMNKLGADIDLVSPLGSLKGRLETERLQKLKKRRADPHRATAGKSESESA